MDISERLRRLGVVRGAGHLNPSPAPGRCRPKEANSASNTSCPHQQE